MRDIIKGLAQEAASTASRAAANYLYKQMSDYETKEDYGKRKKRKRSKTPSGKLSRRKTTTVKMDGVSGGEVRIGKPRRRTKKKKTLKQELSAVKRLIPKVSKKTFRNFTTYVLDGLSNQRIMYKLDAFRPSIYESYAGDLTNVDNTSVADYTTSASSLKMDLYYKYMIKNNATANCTLSYAFMKCKDDDNEDPLDDVLEELSDRGYLNLPLTQNPTSATATASRIPKRIVFGSDGATISPYHTPLFSGTNLLRKWEPVSGVKTVTLGPGDTTNLIWSRKNFTYKPEQFDNEPFAYHGNKSWVLILVCHGDLSHDQNNDQLVGRSGFHLDCEAQRQAVVRYSNPKGLNEIDYADTLLTDANFTTPVHADNKASAIETREI